MSGTNMLYLYSCSIGGQEPSLEPTLSISNCVSQLSPKLRDKIQNEEPGFEASKNLVPDEAELQLPGFPTVQFLSDRSILSREWHYATV